MKDHESDHHVSQLLDELGPADPPAGFARNVMARILDERHATTKRTVPFNQEGIVMTRKAMWGLAAAAAVTLAVFAIKGFPPVDRGTEGTIGAAKKYQAPQLADKDVVLGDAAAQEFLQSEAFDQLLRDPDARSLLTNSALKSYMKNARFVDAIKDPSVRAVLASQQVAAIFADYEARATLEAEIRAGQMASAAARQASAQAAVKSSARAMVEAALANRATADALKNDVVRTALSDDSFRSTMRNAAAAAAMRGDALAAAAAHLGFRDAALSGKLESSLAVR